MSLPLAPPFAPQLARGKTALPDGEGWSFEPKWDGFRAIAFVDSDADPDPDADPDGLHAGGASLVLLSRGGKPLQRYFPELRFPPGRYVLDGEIVIDLGASPRTDEDSGTGTDLRTGSPGARDGGAATTGDGADVATTAAVAGQDFDALSQRIHPAASRVAKLAIELPSRYVAFDLLAVDDLSLLERPFSERRAALERLLARDAFAGTSVSLTPAVATPQEAQDWLRDIEGVVAKETDAPYLPGERKGMVKVKRQRTSDCVVMGWRHGKEEGTVGSLILGLYDDEGELRTVGHTSSFTAKRKRELVAELEPYGTGEVRAGEPSRWKSDKELEWVELRPELVVEVTYDQVSAGRIRHGAKLQRWREDKPPAECTIDQLDE